MRDSEATFQLIHQGMVNAGIEADEVYRRLARSGHIVCRDGRFRHETHVAFWQVLEQITGDPEIGLHLCPHLPLFQGRALEYLFLSSENYAQGLRTLFKYRRLVSDAFHVSLLVDDDGARILIEGAAGEAPELRHTENCTVYAFLQELAVLTDARLLPSRLCLRGQPHAFRHEYERMFECVVEFDDGASEIWFDPTLLEYRSPHSDPDMFKLHCRYADNQLAKLARQDLMDDVYEHLKKQFLAGDGAVGTTQTLQEVAYTFGVSVRHLRFVLSEAGTSFRELLKDARFGFACRTLKKTRESVEEVAFRAGFSEPSTFCRAFKQWAGLTPDQYREARRTLQHAGGENRPGAL